MPPNKRIKSPSSASKAASGSLADNLANAHISEQERLSHNGTPNTDRQDQEEASPVTPQHEQESTTDDPYALDQQDGVYLLPRCPIPSRDDVYAPIEDFAAKAIKSRTDPSCDPDGAKNYKLLMESIRRKEDAGLLRMIFIAIRASANGTTLTLLTGYPTKHAQLLHFLLKFDPFAGKFKLGTNPKCPFSNYEIADSYMQLVLALVSANTVFLIPAMTHMWKLLVTFEKQDFPEARTQRIHGALAAMTRLCPKGKSEIFGIVSANFPFRTRPEKELVWCYQQLLAITGYVPSIQGQVIKFIVDKSLEMDVEIKIHEGGEVTIEEEDNSKEVGLFDLELDSNDVPQHRQSKKDISVDDMAEKLDSVMLLTFEYLEESAKRDASRARNLYELCLPAFESSILITYRSKFVQFLLFYLCGLESKVVATNDTNQATEMHHATLYREFCATLIGIVFDPYRSVVVRQCAVCYLASFLSRAQFAEAETICESLSALLQWAEAYIASLRENAISAADAEEQCELHALFYTICQAAFYMMCFRGVEAVKFYRSVVECKNLPPESVPEDLQEVELAQVEIGSFRWSRLCNHPLQPLRYCLETVREEFLNVATCFDLLDVDLLHRLTTEHQLEISGRRKKKAKCAITGATLEVTRMDGGVGGLGRGSNPLDSFFPFDPYLLRRSHQYVDAFYKNWGDDDEFSDENEEMEEDEEDEEEVSSEVEDDADSTSSEAEGYRRQKASIDETSMIASTPPEPVPIPREPWTETLKRSRAPSIETGSW